MSLDLVQITRWIQVNPKPEGVGMATVSYQNEATMPVVVQLAIDQVMLTVNQGLYGLGGLSVEQLLEGVVTAVNTHVANTHQFGTTLYRNSAEEYYRRYLGELYDVVGAAGWVEESPVRSARQKKEREDEDE